MCNENELINEKCEDSNAKLIIRANDFNNARDLVKKYAKDNSEILNELSVVEKMLNETNEDGEKDRQEIRIRLCKWGFCLTVFKFWKKIDIDININL